VVIRRDEHLMGHHYDAIVVGGRCAGAATAMLLARGGMRVLVVEAARPGTDTLSTHALMRGGVLQLHRWGLLDAVVDAGTPAIRSTEFAYGDDEVETVDIRPSGGISALYAPRRTGRAAPDYRACRRVAHAATCTHLIDVLTSILPRAS
jgi:2-polyprenyl-6-methoxyphenol hydroxylase-like FAD-dependent oxidoreductase